MSYYEILGLEKEPFSTSPDPEFFFFSREHDRAFTNVLIELHLKRGLSVVLGDIGTGKTTLSRKLIQSLKKKDGFVLSIILDPHFKTERLFLMSLLLNFEDRMEKYSPGGEPLRNLNLLELRQVLQKYLYAKCINEKKTVVVMIDEAQKLSRHSLEMLRVMLNYETNETKLLQLVLLGQSELHARINGMANLLDRISFKTRLQPLDLEETNEMIRFRMKKAGYSGDFFTASALEYIHQISKGYPRKITILCHRALKLAISKNQWSVDNAIVQEIIKEDVRSGWLTMTPR